MKLATALLLFVTLSSCGQIKNIMDGTEKLPSQIQETNNGMAKTNEAIRLQKIGVALTIMQDPKNRITLAPIPSDMMSGGKIMGEAVNPEEALHFVKNYLVKINEEIFEDSYPDQAREIQDTEAPPGTMKPNPVYAAFVRNKQADLSMLTVVAGNIPDSVLKEMIKEQSEQGAYRDILFQILKMRATFFSDMMIHAAMIDGDKKLETLGQIEKAIEYNEKVDFICALDFADKVALKITGFEEKANEILSKSLDKGLALANWKKIQEKAESDFKATSYHSEPGKNESSLTEYADRYKKLLQKIQEKVDNSI